MRQRPLGDAPQAQDDRRGEDRQRQSEQHAARQPVRRAMPRPGGEQAWQRADEHEAEGRHVVVRQALRAVRTISDWMPCRVRASAAIHATSGIAQ